MCIHSCFFLKKYQHLFQFSLSYYVLVCSLLIVKSWQYLESRGCFGGEKLAWLLFLSSVQVSRIAKETTDTFLFDKIKILLFFGSPSIYVKRSISFPIFTLDNDEMQAEVRLRAKPKFWNDFFSVQFKCTYYTKCSEILPNLFIILERLKIEVFF